MRSFSLYTALFFFLFSAESFPQGKPPQKQSPAGKPHMGIQNKPGAASTPGKPKPHALYTKPGKPAAGIQNKPKPHPIVPGKPVPVKPRPPGSGIRPDCVGPGHRWVPGRWVYNPRTGQHIWIDGYCMSKKGNSIWIEGHYVETPMGLRWVPGRWITRGYPEYKGKR